MNRIQFYVKFLFNKNDELTLLIEAEWKKKPINLSHSSFLLFLYNHEKELSTKDLDFAEQSFTQLGPDAPSIRASNDSRELPTAVGRRSLLHNAILSFLSVLSFLSHRVSHTDRITPRHTASHRSPRHTQTAANQTPWLGP